MSSASYFTPPWCSPLAQCKVHRKAHSFKYPASHLYSITCSLSFHAGFPKMGKHFFFLHFSTIDLVLAKKALGCEFDTLCTLNCALAVTQIQVANNNNNKSFFFLSFCLGKVLCSRYCNDTWKVRASASLRLSNQGPFQCKGGNK